MKVSTELLNNRINTIEERISAIEDCTKALAESQKVVINATKDMAKAISSLQNELSNNKATSKPSKATTPKKESKPSKIKTSKPTTKKEAINQWCQEKGITKEQRVEYAKKQKKLSDLAYNTTTNHFKKLDKKVPRKEFMKALNANRIALGLKAL